MDDVCSVCGFRDLYTTAEGDQECENCGALIHNYDQDEDDEPYTTE